MPNHNPFSDLNQWIAMLNQVNQLLNSELFQSFNRIQSSPGILPDAYDNSRSGTNHPSHPVADNPPPPGLTLQEMTKILNQINQILNSGLVKNFVSPNTATREENPPPPPDFNQIVKILSELGNLFKNFRPY